MQSKSSSFIYLLLLSVSFFWGTSFAAAKIAIAELEPLNLVILRFTIASIIFAAMLIFKGQATRLERIDVPRFFVLGFLAITSYFYIQFTGLRYTTTINAALIIATSPIWALLFSTLLGWERMTLKGTVGIFIAFTGVAGIITNGQFDMFFASTTLTGDLMLLTNAIVWAGFTVYGRSILQKYSPFVAMAYIHIFGTLMLVPFAFFPGLFSPVSLITQLKAISLTTITAATYLALLCSVYSYHIWYTGVNVIGAVRTAAFAYFNPLFAILAGTWLLGESMTTYTFAGGLMIIGGVYLTNKANARKDEQIAGQQEQ